MSERDETLLALIDVICHVAHKHETQSWLDSPGTDTEKLKAVLRLARDARGLLKGTLRPQDVMGGSLPLVAK